MMLMAQANVEEDMNGVRDRSKYFLRGAWGHHEGLQKEKECTKREGEEARAHTWR